MTLRLITAASTYPITLAEAKAHCRVETTDDDTYLTALIAAATEMAEQHTGRGLMPQTWELTLDAFPNKFELTRVPVQSIASLKYFDPNGAQQTLSNGLYALDNSDGFGFAYVSPIYNGTWPATRGQVNAVALQYVSGYANAAAVPEPLKQWVKLQIGSLYEFREAEVQGGAARLNFADRLIDRYQVWA